MSGETSATIPAMSRTADARPSHATTRSASIRAGPPGPSADHADDAVALADQIDHGLPVGHGHALGERRHDDAVVDGDADRDAVGPHADVAAGGAQALEDAELLEGVVALVAEHEAARSVDAGGGALEHHRVVPARPQQPGEGEADHPATDDDGADHPGDGRRRATQVGRRLDPSAGSWP